MIDVRIVRTTMSNQTLRHTTPVLRILILLTFIASASAETELSGLAHERDLNYAEAAIQYQQEIETIEQQRGNYDLRLFPNLLGLARSLHKLGEFEDARDAAQRAQHISHRHQGVHNETQIQAINLITRIHLAESKPLLANKQQKFAYYVRKSNVEPESLELLPAIEELSNWYEKTGQLQRARKLNEQSIEIVEQHFGEDTTEQLPYLQKLARLKRLQRVCCSTKIMKQALAVIDANPSIDQTLKARTYIEMADAYTISGDKQNAETFYKNAWQILSESERDEQFANPTKIAFSKPLSRRTSSKLRMFGVDRDPFGSREYRQLLEDEIRELESLPPQEFVMNTEHNDYDVRIRDRNLANEQDREPAVRTIGQPYAFLHRQFLHLLPSSQQSDAALMLMQVELEFDVDESGRPSNIEVVSTNAPGKVKRLMKDVVRKSRFRPRMKDGFPVATTQFRLTQSFAAKTTINSESI